MAKFIPCSLCDSIVCYPGFYIEVIMKFYAILDVHLLMDHRTSFRDKPTLELMRALFILKLCSYDTFVNHSLQMMTTAEKILGNRLFGLFMRPTFYNQFIAGDDRKSLAVTIGKLTKANIHPMIACMMEEDLTASEQQQEQKYNNNLYRIITCLELLSSMSKQACLQVKVTGIMSPKLVVKICEKITDYETQKKLAILFADALKTGTLKKSSILNTLSDNEYLALERALMRFAQIGTASKIEGVRILIDSEFVSMNHTLNTIAMAMMIAYNNEKALIWCTIQCYLKSALDIITELFNMAKELKVCFGVKIVRGAYMEQERKLAKMNNYPDPINDTYLGTEEMYLRVVDFVLEQIKGSFKCTVVMATHNETAIRVILQKVIDLELDFQSPQINFAQLYGMSEQVTMPLAKSGVTVFKSIPYGTITETLPYLYRRATENRSIIKGARKEREMLWSELKDRMKLKF
uniref:Proline dehydrogenase n=1 Tax=Strigamia maritima TaxID=126957 RepID=T1J6H7_STRMM